MRLYGTGSIIFIFLVQIGIFQSWQYRVTLYLWAGGGGRMLTHRCTENVLISNPKFHSIGFAIRDVDKWYRFHVWLYKHPAVLPYICIIGRIFWFILEIKFSKLMDDFHTFAYEGIHQWNLKTLSFLRIYFECEVFLSIFRLTWSNCIRASYYENHK